MSSRLVYRSAMVNCTITGDVKMITDVPKAAFQMTMTELFHGEGNIAARRAAMNHQ